MAQPGGSGSKFLERGYHRSWVEVVVRGATKLKGSSADTVGKVSHGVRAIVTSAGELWFAVAPTIITAAANGAPFRALALSAVPIVANAVAHKKAEENGTAAFIAVEAQLESSDPPPGHSDEEEHSPDHHDHDDCGHGDMRSSDPRVRFAGIAGVTAQLTAMFSTYVPAMTLAAGKLSPLPAVIPAIAGVAGIGLAARDPKNPKSRWRLAKNNLRAMLPISGAGIVGYKTAELLDIGGPVSALVQDQTAHVGTGLVALYALMKFHSAVRSRTPRPLFRKGGKSRDACVHRVHGHGHGSLQLESVDENAPRTEHGRSCGPGPEPRNKPVGKRERTRRKHKRR